MNNQFEKYTLDKAQEEANIIQEEAKKISGNENPSSADYQMANDNFDKKSESFYGEEAVYDKIAQGYEKATIRPLRKFAYDYTIEHYVGDLKDKKVLDLACGEGVSTRMLHNLGAKTVHGIDISEKQIELAKKQEVPGVTYEQLDCMSDNFPKKDKFDIVSGMMFIHYAKSKEQIQKVLKNIYSVLEDGGEFYAMTVNPDLLKNGYEKYGIKITPQDEIEGSEALIELHDFNWNKFCEFAIHYWSKETYQEIFENAGFEIEWQPGVVSGEGIDKYGKDFWKDFLDDPAYVIIKAIKK
jgi:2-polyprenyl-3-methyl-5-hydroxy-6-metoxy-1,4-benzoquinol methylase